MSGLSREPCVTPNWVSNHGPWYELTKFLHTLWESWKEQPGDYYQSQSWEVCTELLLSTQSQKFPQDQPLLLYSICHLLLLHAFVPPKEEGPVEHFYVCRWVTIKHWFYSVVCYSTYKILRFMPELCGISRLVKIFCLLFMGGKFWHFCQILIVFCFFFASCRMVEFSGVFLFLYFPTIFLTVSLAFFMSMLHHALLFF